MDRINVKCFVENREVNLQLDKKSMPGEPGPCFMITAGGCFKGYISRQKNGGYKSLGVQYYSNDDLHNIGEQLKNIK